MPWHRKYTIYVGFTFKFTKHTLFVSFVNLTSFFFPAARHGLLVLGFYLKSKKPNHHTYYAADDGTLVVLVECKANKIDGEQNDQRNGKLVK